LVIAFAVDAKTRESGARWIGRSADDAKNKCG